MIFKVWNFAGMRYLRRCISLYFEKEIPRAAAGLSYFLIMSVFPLLICVHAFVVLLHLDTVQILSYLDGVLPQATMDVLHVYLRYVGEASGNESGGLLVAGVIMVFTTASAAFRGVMRSMAGVYGQAPARGLRSLVVSILFPLFLLLTIYLSIGVIVTGDWLIRWVVREFGLSSTLFLWRYLRFLLLFCVFFLFILVISLLAAPRGTPRTPILFGSAVSSFALVAASVLFSWFISLSTRYPLVYGSMVSVIVMMLWLYLCCTILLAGNIISSVWHREHRKDQGQDIKQTLAPLREKQEKEETNLKS